VLQFFLALARSLQVIDLLVEVVLDALDVFAQNPLYLLRLCAGGLLVGDLVPQLRNQDVFLLRGFQFVLGLLLLAVQSVQPVFQLHLQIGLVLQFVVSFIHKIGLLQQILLEAVFLDRQLFQLERMRLYKLRFFVS